MCIHPEAEPSNVLTLTGRRTASPFIGQNSTKAAVIRPEVARWVDSTLPEPSEREVETFDGAQHRDWEDIEAEKLGGHMTRTDWARIGACVVGWFAFVAAAGCFAGYADGHGWISLPTLTQLSKLAP